MGKEIVELLLAIICGCSFGISVSLGFWPQYDQPKNIRNQLYFFLIGVFAFIVLLILI